MTSTKADPQLIDELLSRSVEEVIPSKDALREALLSGNKLRIYIGTDATGTSLHLGHATNYMVLEKFRRLGHEVIFLIGDFTARIGDPTDKGETARKQLTREQVMENVQSWIAQIKPVIDVENAENPVRILYNHDWLSKLTFEDVTNLASHFTVQQMLDRDMFQKRIKEEKPLYLHELMYPLMQGYDSVAMDVDIELCGMDQKFNALAGRTLQRKMKDREKFVFITTLLENPVTGEKMMSKSMGTGVFLDFDATRMYGAIMAQPDENMKQLFTDCTWLPLGEIEEILKAENPRDAKMQLARQITWIFHGHDAAELAEANFVHTFQDGGLPLAIREIHVGGKSNMSVASMLLAENITASNSDTMRVVDQKGLKINNKIATREDVNRHLDFDKEPEIIIQKGKRTFLKLVR
jgi:tyrosyl-tRNA synthetase